MHHIHLHFGSQHSGHGFGRFDRGHHGATEDGREDRTRGRGRSSPELRLAWRELKTALIAQSNGPPDVDERMVGILNRATIEILGR